MLVNLEPWSTINQSDGIYSGQLNKSYQKQGFGVFQNLDFASYFGHWRANEAHGLGLLIMKNPLCIIYGYFEKNQLSGMFVYHTAKRIICGTAEKSKIRGIKFEYTNQEYCWMMVDTKTGEVLAVEKEIAASARSHQDENTRALYPWEVRPPKILSTEIQLYGFLKEYLTLRMFQQHNLVHLKGDQMEIGRTSEHGLQGLACVINRKQPRCTLVGNFQSGVLQGYVYQSLAKENAQNVFVQSVGRYSEGKLHGLLYQRDSRTGIEQLSEYKRGKKCPEPVARSSTTASSLLKTLNIHRKKQIISSSSYLDNKVKLDPQEIFDKMVSEQLMNKQAPQSSRKHRLSSPPRTDRSQTFGQVSGSSKKRIYVPSSYQEVPSSLDSVRKKIENKEIDFVDRFEILEAEDDRIQREENPFERVEIQTQEIKATKSPKKLSQIRNIHNTQEREKKLQASPVKTIDKKTSVKNTDKKYIDPKSPEKRNKNTERSTSKRKNVSPTSYRSKIFGK